MTAEEKRAKHAAYMRDWAARNPERKREADARYRAQPEKAEAGRKRARDWYQANKHRPEVRERLRRQEQTRRARLLAATEGSVCYDAVVEAAGGVCGICGGELDETFHFDHIVPLSRGGKHSQANLQLAHPFCNWSKNNRFVTPTTGTETMQTDNPPLYR